MESYTDPIHCPACGVKFKVAIDDTMTSAVQEEDDTRKEYVETPKIAHKRKVKRNGKKEKVLPVLTNGNTRELITGLLRDLPAGSYLSAGAISQRVGKTINSTTSTLLQMTQKGELERVKNPNQPFAYRLIEKQTVVVG